MIEWLATQGHSCTVLTSYPYYPYWKVQQPYRKHRFGYLQEVTHYASGGRLQVMRCPMYVPSQPSGFKRILLDCSFSLTCFFAMLSLVFSNKYDWVISVAPSFQFGLFGVWLKKIKRLRHWYHIQDLQIEAAFDLGMIKSKYLLKYLFSIERNIFRHTDIISSISEGMIECIERKAQKPVLKLPNWTDLENFYPLTPKKGLKEEYGYHSSDWVVLYSGAIGEKQGLEAIIYAAEALQEHESLKFIICGTGPYKEKLMAMAEEMKLGNIRFLPLQPKDSFNAFLNMADLHLVIQKEKASDLVMPSKLTTILAIGGLALITSNPEYSLHKLISKYQMGLLTRAEDQQALNNSIVEAYLNREDPAYTEIKNAARSYAEEYLAKDKVMQVFESTLMI